MNDEKHDDHCNIAWGPCNCRLDPNPVPAVQPSTDRERLIADLIGVAEILDSEPVRNEFEQANLTAVEEAIALLRQPDLTPPEICICAAVKADDKVFRCHRHHHGLKMVHDAEQQDHALTFMSVEQGFITSRNRFVGREEALKLQQAAGLPSVDPSGYRARELFSEDLY